MGGSIRHIYTGRNVFNYPRLEIESWTLPQKWHLCLTLATKSKKGVVFVYWPGRYRFHKGEIANSIDAIIRWLARHNVTEEDFVRQVRLTLKAMDSWSKD